MADTSITYAPSAPVQSSSAPANVTAGAKGSAPLNGASSSPAVVNGLPAGVWRGTVGNVLCEAMKFGKLLNRVRNDGRVYLNYKELKQCMTDRDVFKEKLQREIQYVDSFYCREEAALRQAEELTPVAIAALSRLVIINILASHKIVAKHERFAGAGQSVRTEILEFLKGASFYGAFRSSSLFVAQSLCASGLTPPQLQRYADGSACLNCRQRTPHMAPLSSCTHYICWDCVLKKDETLLNKCPSCAEQLSLTSASVLNEEVLGAEPRQPLRKDRRIRKQARDQQPAADGSASSDEDEKDAAPEASSEAASGVVMGKVLSDVPAQVSNVAITADGATFTEPPAGSNAALSQRNRYYCHDCAMVLNSFRQALIHVNGQRHLDQVTRLQERCAREGVPYSSPGLVNYTDDLKVEGTPKPRRSRGGAKKKLEAKRLQQEKQNGKDDSGSCHDSTAPTEADSKRSVPPSLISNDTTVATTVGQASEQRSVKIPIQAEAPTVHPQPQQLPSARLQRTDSQRHNPYGPNPPQQQQQQQTGQQPARQAFRVLSIAVDPNQQFDTQSLTDSHSCGSPNNAAAAATKSTDDLFKRLPSNDPGASGYADALERSCASNGPSMPPLSSYGGDPPPSWQAPMSQQQQQQQYAHMPRQDSLHDLAAPVSPHSSHRMHPPQNNPYAPQNPYHNPAPAYSTHSYSSSTHQPYPDQQMYHSNGVITSSTPLRHVPAQKTHAFQIEKHNSDLRHSMETVIAKKDSDGSSLQKIKKFMVDEDGCQGLVDEIYHSIFNGENSVEYSELCQSLVECEDADVQLVRHEFIHLLLSKCKKTVTAAIVRQATHDAMPQEQVDAIEEKELRYRFRRAAAVKFSADLFSKRILPEAMVHVCIQTMLFGAPLCAGQSPDEIALQDDGDGNEDNLATACRILSTVGERLKQSNPTFLDMYRGVLEKSLENITSSRVKRKVRDILKVYTSQA